MTDPTINRGRTDPPGIRLASRDDAEALAEVVSDALYDDPPNVWAFPDPVRRREIMPRFFRLFVDASIEAGAAFTVEDRSAVCLWFPPGWMMTDEEEQAFERDVRAATGEFAEPGPIAIVRAIGEIHPLEPHWYLAFVCTRPDQQGLGLGTALIREGLGRCDLGGFPAYLEATSMRNRDLYERLGFRVMSTIELPAGPTLWAMWREPLP